MRGASPGDYSRPAKALLVGAALVLLPVAGLHGRAPRAAPRLTAAPTDSFPHERHTRFACLTCHFAAGGHGRLTFEPPRGCQLCHHQPPAESNCGACHQPGELPTTITVPVSISVRGAMPRTRAVAFPHGTHADVGCVRCHTTPVSFAPGDTVLTCHGCHGDHHVPGRRCATCHQTEAITAAHEPPRFTHTACDACHTSSRVALLVPTRSFCLVCHDRAQNHNAPKECTSCHFDRTPEEFRRQLVRSRTP